MLLWNGYEASYQLFSADTIKPEGSGEGSGWMCHLHEL
jgi:hypothetical protein